MKVKFSRVISLLVSCFMVISVFSVVPVTNASAAGNVEIVNIFGHDFNDLAVSDSVGAFTTTSFKSDNFTGITQNNETNYFKVRKKSGTDSDNYIYLEFNGTGSSYPTFYKTLNLNGYSKIRISADILNPNGYEFSVSDGTTKQYISLPAASSWTNVYADIDLSNWTYTTSFSTSGTLTLSNAKSNVQIGMRFKMKNGYTASTDNFYVSSIESAGDIELDPTVKQTLDNLSAASDNPVTSWARNSHPRLHLTSFEPMYEKICSDSLAASFYADIKAAADAYVSAGTHVEYETTRNSLLNVSREIFKRAYIVAFTYNIEKLSGASSDSLKAYRDFLAGEMRSAASFENWTPSSFLATAEMMHAFSVAYDWCYDAFTAAEKNMMLKAVLEKGLYQSVLHYEGKGSGTKWTGVTHNWNIVCNAGSLFGAFMVYDRYPNVAQYIINKYEKSIKNGLSVYAAGGAFPETIMYWDYATNYVVYAESAAMTFAKDGSCPQGLRICEKPGFDTTGDFVMGYQGNMAAFNTGDSSRGFGGGAGMFYLSKRFNKPQYAAFEYDSIMRHMDLKHINTSGRTYTDNETFEPRSKLYALLWSNPSDYDPSNLLDREYTYIFDTDYNTAGTVMKDTLNSYTARSSFDEYRSLYTAMKGGSNASNHNFADLGTFCVDWHGQRFVHLNGSHDYNATGPANMYYVERTEGQNTVLCDNGESIGQVSGAYAKILSSGKGKSTSYAVFDMTQTNTAYSSAKRSIMMTDNYSKIVIQDEITMNGSGHDVYWFAHTNATLDNITISEDKKSAVLKLTDKNNVSAYMLVRIIGGDSGLTLGKMNALPLNSAFIAADDKSGTAEAPSYMRKLYIHKQNASSFKAAVEFIPLLDSDSSKAEDAVYMPISNISSLNLDYVIENGQYVPDAKKTSDDYADTSWYSDKNDSFTLSDKADIFGLSKLVRQGKSFEGKTVNIASDIDLSDDSTFIPIGNKDFPFMGTFNGKGKSISNLNSDCKGLSGLFGYTKNAVIKDVKVSGSSSSDLLAGIVAGYAYNTEFVNVTASGYVYSGDYAGSVAGGLAFGSAASNCKAEAQIETGITAIASGGLFGYVNHASVKNCYSTSNPKIASEYTSLAKSTVKYSSKKILSKTLGATYSETTENLYTPSQSSANSLLNSWVESHSDEKKYFKWDSLNIVYAMRHVGENRIAGDANGDTNVNNRDAARILQYLSEWMVEIDMENANVNGDKTVSNRDAARILQYLSEWEVELL